MAGSSGAAPWRSLWRISTGLCSSNLQTHPHADRVGDICLAEALDGKSVLAVLLTPIRLRLRKNIDSDKLAAERGCHVQLGSAALSNSVRRKPQQCSGWLLGLSAVVAVATLALGSMLIYLKLHESELVFHTALSHAHTTRQLPWGAQSIVIHGAGGYELAGLIMRPQSAKDSGLWILHLHGNATSAFSPEQLRHCESLRNSGFNVLSFDYRGFGLSAGEATESHVDQDAEAAFDELRRRGIAASQIIVWGHSLGSGPAVLLASNHAVAALVLFGAFTSIADAAQDTYRYLPVKWLVGIRFDSIDLIRQVHVPVLIAHSVSDSLVPFHHAQRLFAAANEPKRLLLLHGVYTDGFGGHVAALYDHLDLLLPALFALIGQPLGQMPARGADGPQH
jgi:uncharacterized protein